jgi:hypothetical protein
MNLFLFICLLLISKFGYCDLFKDEDRRDPLTIARELYQKYSGGVEKPLSEITPFPWQIPAENIGLNEFNSARKDLILKLREFRYISQLARKHQSSISITGISALKLAFYIKWYALALSNKSGYQIERFDFKLSSIFPEIGFAEVRKQRYHEQSKLKNEDYEQIRKEYFDQLSLDYGKLRLKLNGPASAALSMTQEINDRFKHFQVEITGSGMEYNNDLFAIEAIEGDIELNISDVDRDFNLSPRLNKLLFQNQIDINIDKMKLLSLEKALIEVMKIICLVSQFELKLSSAQIEFLKNLVDQSNVKNLKQNSLSYSPQFYNEWSLLKALMLYNSQNYDLLVTTINQLDPNQNFFQIKKIVKSFPIGRKNGRWMGKSAKEMGIEYLTHETGHGAYWYNNDGRYHLTSLRSSMRGAPLVQQYYSLRGKVGFYTMNALDRFFGGDGRWGRYKLAYKLHPEARLNSDFFVFKDEVRVVNPSVLEVIPFTDPKLKRHLELNPLDAFKAKFRIDDADELFSDILGVSNHAINAASDQWYEELAFDLPSRKRLNEFIISLSKGPYFSRISKFEIAEMFNRLPYFDGEDASAKKLLYELLVEGNDLDLIKKTSIPIKWLEPGGFAYPQFMDKGKSNVIYCQNILNAAI